jgi:Na+/H+ antiporter NhaB
MDRFSDEPHDGEATLTPFLVENFEVTHLEGLEVGQEKMYGVVLSGILEDHEVATAFQITGRFAALLAAHLARAAVKACDEYFASAILVGLTESPDETRQHLSQNLGHEANG